VVTLPGGVLVRVERVEVVLVEVRGVIIGDGDDVAGAACDRYDRPLD
jgi:hypothetical protein